MEVTCGTNFCKANVAVYPHCRPSQIFLGERKFQNICKWVELESSTPAAHCSTSGASRISFHRGQRRRGKCWYAREDSGNWSDQVSLIDSVDEDDNSLEVLAWRAHRSSQGQELREEAKKEVEQSDTGDTAFQTEAISFGIFSRADKKLEEEAEGQNGKIISRGWRELAVNEGEKKERKSKIFTLKKPMRSSKIVRQRVNYQASSPPREGVLKVLLGTRDSNIDGLFKSLASSDRSSAVERYFGRELSEAATASNKNSAPVETSMGKILIAGEPSREEEMESKSASPFVSKAGRLKINLALDLYRAKCLRESGNLGEAEAILKECIRDWPEDGRAYLAMGLLALPLSRDQTGANNAGIWVDLNEDVAEGMPNERTVVGSNLNSGDDAEGGRTSSTLRSRRSPAISERGERLKINLDLQLYQAKCLRQRGRLSESEEVLRKCIRDWPDDGRPYVVLGNLLLKQNRVQEARTTYDIGCQAVRGENPYIWQAWAILEEKNGDAAKARKLFDAATVADKTHSSAWHGWAKLELRANNVKLGRSLLNKGLRFGGANEYILQTLALLEFRDGNIEQARLLLTRAVQHNPKSAASWLAWALMESQNNLTETARRLFQKGLISSPKNRYLWQAWAIFEAKQGKLDQARELFQRGHELNPQDAVLLQAFALFEFDCDRPETARDLFRRALNCDATHQPIWIAWGWMEWKQGNLSVARELYQGAIRTDATSMDAARAFQAWGVLEDREGACGIARELFKCALKVDSQNVPTWMAWAAMEEREGRPVRANEIRNLFLQQRTEVVEGIRWDVDISDLLAPAIDRIKGFFNVDKQPTLAGNTSESGVSKEALSQGDALTGQLNGSVDVYSDGQGFDLDSFLEEKFPRKYGSKSRALGLSKVTKN